MKNSKYILMIAVVLGSVTAALAGDVKMIANSSVGVSAVSADEIKAVFLATKSSLSDGSHVEQRGIGGRLPINRG